MKRLALAWIGVCVLLRGQSPVDDLVARLARPSLDYSALHEAEGFDGNTRVRQAVEAAFERSHDRADKQWIAVSLVRMRADDRYFDFLAGLAKTAVEDRTPQIVVTRGVISAEFRNWCEQRQCQQNEVARLQLDQHPRDVEFLARTGIGAHAICS